MTARAVAALMAVALLLAFLAASVSFIGTHAALGLCLTVNGPGSAIILHGKGCPP